MPKPSVNEPHWDAAQEHGAFRYPPGADPPPDAVEVMVKREDTRDFFEGES